MARTVYVIEILPHWHDLVAPNLLAGKKCFYVGETGKDPLTRLEEHLTGNSSTGNRKNPSAAVFKRMRKSQGGRRLRRGSDVWMRFQLAARLAGDPVKTNVESLERERIVIEALQQAGHKVYGS